MPKSVHRSITGGGGAGPVRHVVGERLVQPQVVPPGHRDQVAEPHVSHLVGHGPRPPGPLRLGGLTPEDHLVPQGDAARVLHRPGVEVRHEGLVVLTERIPGAEDLMEVVEGLLGHRDQVDRLPLELLSERRPGVQPEPDPVVLVVDRGVRSGHQGDEIRGQGLKRSDPPSTRLQLLTRSVPDHRPVRRRRDLELVVSLQVGLVETGEPAGSGIQERHGVEVGLPVGRIDVAVQALAVGGVGHHTVDHQGVGGLQGGQRDPTVPPGRRSELDAVQPGGHQPTAVEVDEGRRTAAGELDRRPGAELLDGLVGEVELDPDQGHGEQRGPVLRFGPGQAGVAHNPASTRKWS